MQEGKAFPESLESHDDVGMMHISAYQCFSPESVGVTNDWCIRDKNPLTCLKNVCIISSRMPVLSPRGSIVCWTNPHPGTVLTSVSSLQ